jgi:hypothetical protein
MRVRWLVLLYDTEIFWILRFGADGQRYQTLRINYGVVYHIQRTSFANEKRAASGCSQPLVVFVHFFFSDITDTATSETGYTIPNIPSSRDKSSGF